MKKLYVTLLSALVAGGASAQTLSNDRMVVTNSIGQTTSYAGDRIQSLVTLMLCLLSSTFSPRQEQA